MANLSDLTRKEQVLAYLTAHKGEWVDGTDIMNEKVGGQRGGARIFDLRDDGWLIQARRHPDPLRDIWQYRLIDPAKPPLKADATPTPTPVEKAARPAPVKGPIIFGLHRVCPTCKAMRKSCGACGGRGYIEAQPGT